MALHLGLIIQGTCGLSQGGNSLRRKAMVTKWVQREDLEPSWSKLEEALVSANQEPHATEVREGSRTPTNPAITANATITNSKEAIASDHDSEKGIQVEEFIVSPKCHAYTDSIV